MAASLLGRSLLRGSCSPLGRGLFGRSLLRGRCSPLGRGLLGRSLLHGGLLRRSRLLGRSLLHCGLLRRSRLLGRSLLHCRLLSRRLLGRLLRSTACDDTTLHSWSFRWEFLCARDNRFELCAGPERRHRGRLDLHRLAGTRVAGHTGRAAALLEHTETGNCDALTFLHRANDGVDKILDGRRCVPTVRAQFLSECIDELCLVDHPYPPKLVVLVGPTSKHGKPSSA